MESALQKLMILVFLAIIVLSPASAKDARELDKYLDCLTDKNIDIVFVFDTSNSMGGEINELRAIARDFAKDLDASRIDYRLGLVEFRDFPQSCKGSDVTACGSPGDFPYIVKGDGNLTTEIDTFNSWLKELKAGGGGSFGPEAVLAAIRHAMSDCQWRSDAEKVIIVLTDAPPHPDGDCCNAEGDTLEGTIFGLAGEGARAYVVGPENAALKRIAGDTGGQFYKIRSGVSLKPLLKEITGAMSCSFRIETEATCENKTLVAKVRLVGKEVIPYVAGQTEAWMYINQSRSSSRYNLNYDSTTGAYLAEVPGVCGPV
ncbi:MAG TPA: vWA domain-containing protein, partial [Methanotrichaceae archaeon]|nr:vWA domain-containing protein [Methanotrichaceae archaeon]